MNQQENMRQRLTNRLNIFRRIHNDERGGVSIETVLIIAAIALPILIYLIKVGWPRMQAFFNQGMQSLEDGAGTTGS
jgi:Flp pilus assembly pilin Flp